MTLPRQKSREIVFLLLFSSELQSDLEEIVPLVMEQLKVTKKDVRASCDRVYAILEKIESIDSMIKECSTEFDFDRIQKVELNVIRLGIYEALYDEGIPYKVAVSEAMRMCKKFSTQEAVAFVNAIIDKACSHDKEAPKLSDSE